MHVLRIDGSNARSASMGGISRVVDSCADRCHCCFYLACLYKCDTMGMGVKKSRKTRQTLPNTDYSRQRLRRPRTRHAFCQKCAIIWKGVSPIPPLPRSQTVHNSLVQLGLMV